MVFSVKNWGVFILTKFIRGSKYDNNWGTAFHGQCITFGDRNSTTFGAMNRKRQLSCMDRMHEKMDRILPRSMLNNQSSRVVSPSVGSTVARISAQTINSCRQKLIRHKNQWKLTRCTTTSCSIISPIQNVFFTMVASHRSFSCSKNSLRKLFYESVNTFISSLY